MTHWGEMSMWYSGDPLLHLLEQTCPTGTINGQVQQHLSEKEIITRGLNFSRIEVFTQPV